MKKLIAFLCIVASVCLADGIILNPLVELDRIAGEGVTNNAADIATLDGVVGGLVAASNEFLKALTPWSGDVSAAGNDLNDLDGLNVTNITMGSIVIYASTTNILITDNSTFTNQIDVTAQ